MVDLHQLRTPFVVVGAVATTLDMPERVTHDTDILVRAGDASAVAAELRAAGFEEAGQLTIGGVSWRGPDGELDVIALDEPWVTEAIGNPSRSPSGLPVISLPYLVLIKLRASWTIDLSDITRMLGGADETARDAVRAAITEYRPDARKDIETMIYLGALELESPEWQPHS